MYVTGPMHFFTGDITGYRISYCYNVVVKVNVHVCNYALRRKRDLVFLVIKRFMKIDG